MLKWMNLSYEEIDYIDLNSSDQDFSNLYKVIFFPGGMAYHYNNLICSEGKERIRNFVQNGGGYFGICAGSFFAADQALWDDYPGGGNPVLYDDDTGYLNFCGGPSGYSLDLFPGVGVGPINGIASFYDLYQGWAMATITFQSNNVLPHFRGSNGLKTMPFSEEIMYYGGPYFILDETAPNYENISGYQELATYDYNDEAAIVSFKYGNGKVVLCGPHPEIEENSHRDRENLMDYPYSPRKKDLDDKGSDWELVSQLFAWIMDVEQPVSFVIIPPQIHQTVQGGTIGVIAQTLTNNFEFPSTVNLLSYVIVPGGFRINLKTFSIDINAGATELIKIRLPIPEEASIGNYIFGVQVLGETGTLLDQDFFSFQVNTSTENNLELVPAGENQKSIPWKILSTVRHSNERGGQE